MPLNSETVWHVYVEIRTAVLLDGESLSAVAAALNAVPEVQTAEVAAASLGNRFTTIARITLAAANAEMAQQRAAEALTQVLTQHHARPGKVVKTGLIDPM